MERIKKDKTGPMRLQTPEMLKRREKDVLKVWMEKQLASITLRLDLISKEDLERQTRGFLTVFIKAISGGNLENIETPEYKPIIKMLEDISKNRADQGFSCSETATYVFSLQDTILQFLQEEYIDRPEIINQEIVLLSKLITKLGLVTIESFIKSREKIIEKQSDLMIELSIPVMILAQRIS